MYRYRQIRHELFLPDAIAKSKILIVYEQSLKINNDNEFANVFASTSLLVKLMYSIIMLAS